MTCEVTDSPSAVGYFTPPPHEAEHLDHEVHQVSAGEASSGTEINTYDSFHLHRYAYLTFSIM